MDDYESVPDWVKESANPEYEAHLFLAYEDSFKGNDSGNPDVTSTFSYYL